MIGNIPNPMKSTSVQKRSRGTQTPTGTAATQALVTSIAVPSILVTTPAVTPATGAGATSTPVTCTAAIHAPVTGTGAIQTPDTLTPKHDGYSQSQRQMLQPVRLPQWEVQRNQKTSLCW